MAELGNPQNTIEVLQKYRFNFQKKFGQNFLIDTHVLDKIIDASGVKEDDFVLEIGPGIGTMTQYLCERAREVVAVEIDKNLIPILSDTLKNYSNVTVINEDILKLDICKLAEEKNQGKPICLIILPHRLSWDCLKAMCQLTALRLWCRRKWQSVCRRNREARNMEHFPLQYSIMRNRKSWQMYHRTVLCQDRM